MNSAYDLPSEDHAEFEQVLDEALRTIRLTTGADRYRIASLRAEAIDAASEIAATAADEYRRFDDLRQRSRGSPTPAPAPATSPRAGQERPGGGLAGLLAAASALVPVLAAIAAVIFLGLGYGLGLADPEPALAGPMRQAGWVFAVIAALGLLLALAALVVAAARNGSATAVDAARPATDLSRAREEWRRALLDHGIMPFLRERTPATPAARGDGTPGGPARRTPRLRFSSPRFTSPDFTGPDEDADDRDHSRTRPRYTHPGFSNPGFTSPAEGGADRD